jgi:Tfp pilus assembly protein PilO
MQKNMDKGWVKKYRIWLLVLLVLVIVGTGWYCIAAIQKNKVPEDATLVQGEAWEDEGEA